MENLERWQERLTRLIEAAKQKRTELGLPPFVFSDAAVEEHIFKRWSGLLHKLAQKE